MSVRNLQSYALTQNNPNEIILNTFIWHVALKEVNDLYGYQRKRKMISFAEENYAQEAVFR